MNDEMGCNCAWTDRVEFRHRQPIRLSELNMFFSIRSQISSISSNNAYGPRIEVEKPSESRLRLIYGNVMKFLLNVLFCVFCVNAYAADGDLPESVGQPLTAANDSQLTAALNESSPGQHIILTGSSYSNNRTLGSGDVIVALDISNPPTVSAKYTLSGADSIVHGLDFNGGYLVITGDRAQVLRCYIHNVGAQVPIAIDDGDDVVIACNEIFNWGAEGECEARRGIRIKAPRPEMHDGARRPRISWNYIHDQINYNPETCSPDAEVISVGYGGGGQRGQSKLEAWIHHNYIVNCVGDKEGIGVKSSYNLIEFNHLSGLRGFNNRHGGFNEYIGNRIENIQGEGMRHNRGGYRNKSIGEVTTGSFQVESGGYNFGEIHGESSTYMRSEGVQIIGSKASSFEIGVNKGNLDAIDVLIENTNIPPNLLSNQSSTINRWDQPASISVPRAIRLTPNDVGPLSNPDQFVQSEEEIISVTVLPSGSIDFGHSPIGSVSERVVTITNNGDSAVSGSLDVPLPFSIHTGGVFSNVAIGASVTATVRYSPNSATQHSEMITVTLNEGLEIGIPVSGIGLLHQSSHTFDANSGTISGPFVDSGTFISQPDHTTNENGGTAVYNVNITEPGHYIISAIVDAGASNTNSFYIEFDEFPSGTSDIWDIISVTNGFESRIVSKRGTGTFTEPEFSPAVWNLSSGDHTLIIQGRERDTLLRSISIVPFDVNGQLLPISPDSLNIATN